MFTIIELFLFAIFLCSWKDIRDLKIIRKIEQKVSEREKEVQYSHKGIFDFGLATNKLSMQPKW